jgi:hypothetical protein
LRESSQSAIALPKRKFNEMSSKNGVARMVSGLPKAPRADFSLLRLSQKSLRLSDRRMNFSDILKASRDTEVNSVRQDMMSIAQGEITRQRGRLHGLTTEQHSVVEALLASTVERISGQIMRHIEDYPESIRAKYVNLWSAAAQPHHAE